MSKMIVVRIKGMVNVDTSVQETLYRLRLRRKYVAVIIEGTKENMKLLQRVRDFIAYGPLNDDTAEKLIRLRGTPIGKKKIDSDKAVEELKKKSVEEIGLKPFFRLHPPRGGIESKKHFGVGKGVLGNNGDKINALVERML